tara:strand:+ start:4549 stop:5673 length:1125 start_codon:yes stop_codon:yes gene_type:complete
MKVNQFQPFIGDEEYKAIKSCFDINWITEGPKSKEFSENLLELMGSKYGVFAQNGTIALYLGLRAIGIGRGDEVIVPNFTFIASANAVEMCGAKPVFVDINEDDLQINIKDCNRVLNKNTKAIMPVHIFGLSANMDEVMDFSNKNNLKVIEDAAQAIGVKWDGKHCGTFGDVGCFSFFADKTITTGEGGFVTTNDEKIYNKMLYLRNQGRLNRGSFVHPEIGYNFRITDIQAAMGIVQLNKLGDIISRKLNLLKIYKEKLGNINGIRIVEPNSKSNHIPFRVVLICDEPIDDLMNHFSDNGIETRTVFYPLHEQPPYRNLDESQDWVYERTFSKSIYAYKHGICLPSYPELEKSKVDYICETIKKYYDKNNISR